VSDQFEYIPNHPDAAKTDLPNDVWRHADTVKALAAAIGEGCQVIEDHTYEILSSTSLATASGETLDKWGAFLDERRGAFDDDENFRAFLAGKILVNLCEGTTDELIEIYQVLTQPGLVEHWSLHPASAHLTTYRSEWMDKHRRLRIRQLMERAAPAGCSLVLTESPFAALDASGTLQPGGFARLI
jgi:predicted nuclease with RNAse H fold